MAKAGHRANAQRQQFEQFMHQVPKPFPRTLCNVPLLTSEQNTNSVLHGRPAPREPAPLRPRRLRMEELIPQLLTLHELLPIAELQRVRMLALIVQEQGLIRETDDQRPSVWICRRTTRTTTTTLIGPS